MVGKTEAELDGRLAFPYEVGVARYREIAHGHIIGDNHRPVEDSSLHRPHAKRVGSPLHRRVKATEIVHIGQAVMALGGTIDYLPRHGVQLPHDGRVLQGRRTGRDEQGAHAQPVPRLMPIGTGCRGGG